MKKSITLFLLCTALCATVFAQKASDFKTDGNGTITGFEGWDTVIVIPAQIGDVPITAIGDRAFQKQGITSITFPASIKYIGEYAFYSNKLTSVTLPVGVVVGRYAFYDNQLTNITVNEKANIADSAFFSNKLTRLTLPAKVTISNSAFKGNNLTTITIGDDSIIGNAFNNDNLKTVTLGARISINWDTFNSSVYYDYMLNNRKAGTYDNTVKYVAKTEGDFKYIQTKYGLAIIEYTNYDERLQVPAKLGGVDVKGICGSVTYAGYQGAFEGKTINRIQLPTGLVIIGDRAFLQCNSLTNIIIPDSVTSIGYGAFAGCTSLSSITMPNSITNIGISAFEGCNFTSITLPAGVTSIGGGAFSFCAKLIEINVDSANTAYIAENGVLYNKDKTALVAYPGGKTGVFTIPDGVTSIEDKAFLQCSISSVIIPNSVASIGIFAFSNCTNLTSVTFQGQIHLGGFNNNSFDNASPFPGNLAYMFFEKNETNGTPGTYKRSSGSSGSWTKQ